ncbi:tyrosine-type recombinase/integrase [Methylocella sp.]|jgi:integrase|uniref:tyrosine-type recombinase/integrase n=1 Tax=Methylocella sp. TaxID=1978226 RepID=UPI003C1F8E02
MEKRLTPTLIKGLTKPGDYPDGGGLYLQIIDGVNGGLRRSWLYRYKSRVTRKERCMGLGPLARINLVEARNRRDAARATVEDGGDPLIDKASKREAEAVKTFDQCASAYVNANKATWSGSHHRQFINSLQRYASPVFGGLPVSAIDTELVTRALEPIWTAKHVTAGRVRNRIEIVLDYAKAKGYRTGENPAALKGHLSNILPSHKRLATPKHFEAMPYADAAGFYRTLAADRSIPAAALRFVMLTGARSGEAIGARWSEINLDEALWIVPAERMKARREFRVPLSGEALGVLRAMAAIRRNEFVFQGQVAKHISDTTLRETLRRTGVQGATLHGMRSTLSDWANDKTDFPREIIEASLAHAVGNATERAYRRGDALEKRRPLMQQWSAYLTAAPVAAKSRIRHTEMQR